MSVSGGQQQRQQPTREQNAPATQQQQQQQGVCSQPKQQNAPRQPQQVPGRQPDEKSKPGPSQRRDHSQASQVSSVSSQKSSESKKLASSVPTAMPHMICEYKGTGTRGIKFKSPLETNYLKLIINKMKDIAYHYDVQIEPDKPKKHMTKVFQIFCQNNFRNIGIAFDGAHSAYAPQKLNLNKVVREVEFLNPQTGGTRKYLVAIKPTDQLEVNLGSLKT